jgi:hypothetical protein
MARTDTARTFNGSVANLADRPAWLKLPAKASAGQQVMIEFKRGPASGFRGCRAAV